MSLLKQALRFRVPLKRNIIYLAPYDGEPGLAGVHQPAGSRMYTNFATGNPDEGIYGRSHKQENVAKDDGPNNSKWKLASAFLRRPTLGTSVPKSQSTLPGGHLCFDSEVVTGSYRLHLSGQSRRRHITTTPDSVPEEVIVERLGGNEEGVVVLALNRPKARNALGNALVRQLSHAVAALQLDSRTRVVILASRVEGVFCAGADLKERSRMTAAEIQRYVTTVRSTFASLEALPVPVIAAIEGAALGGGLELALSCDFRIAGSNALLGLPETSLAIIPGAGGTQRLPRAVGGARAKELIFTARRISADAALSIGLVNHSVPAGEALAKALSVACEIIPQGPVAIKMAKIAIERGLQADLGTGMAIEEACYAQTLPTRDRLEGLAAFAQKRKPVYTGE